ncbi:hypothetical protein V2G26_015917 [Clonostachys chloroleuca]
MIHGGLTPAASRWRRPHYRRGQHRLHVTCQLPSPPTAHRSAGVSCLTYILWCYFAAYCSHLDLSFIIPNARPILIDPSTHHPTALHFSTT